MGKAEIFNVPDGESPPGLIDLDELTDAGDASQVSELDAETLSALGAGLTVGAVEFAPPSVACLALLEIIDSPFLSGAAARAGYVEQLDMFRTLYVLHYRAAAVAPVSAMRKAEDAARRMVASTGDAAGVMGAYMDSVRSAWEAFDKCALEFGDTLGVFDSGEAMSGLQGYLLACMGGYELLPDSDEPQSKKKEVMTPNG